MVDQSKVPYAIWIIFFSMVLLVLLLIFSADPAPAQAQASTATPIPLPTITPVGFAQPFIPVVADVLYATATPIGGCFTPLFLKPGDYAYIRSGVNVRHLPTLSGAPVAYTSENIDVVITEGPVCADGYNWWRVSGPENPGWVAEGRIDVGFYLIPYNLDLSGSCVSLYALAAGKRAELLVNTRVREAANPDALVKTVAPAGSMVDIIGGPQCVGGYYWWEVRVTVVDFTYQGWMAEGQDQVYWLVPEDAPSTEDGTLCAPPLKFAQGTRGLVRYRDGTPKYLRAAPGTDGDAMFSLVNNVPFIVIGGPICRNNLNWWKIRVLASTEVIGWMAEGSPGVGYWMTTLQRAYPQSER